MKLRCPICRQTFKWDPKDRWPDECQVCGEYIGSDEKNEVAAPYLALKGGAFAKSVDQVYKDSERGAEARIEAAVAATPGSSKDDFAALKITDFRSNMVEGEAAAKMPEPSKEFTRNVAALQSGGVPVQQNGMMDLSGQTAAFSQSSRTGPEPNAGVRAMDRLRNMHKNNVDPRMNTPISSIPALETQNPNYTPRGAPIIPGVGR